jgi:hypothetical protein
MFVSNLAMLQFTVLPFATGHEAWGVVVFENTVTVDVYVSKLVVLSVTSAWLEIGAITRKPKSAASTRKPRVNSLKANSAQ